MTSPTIEGALAEERARRDEYLAQVRAEAWRAGAEAMRDLAASEILAQAANYLPDGDGNREAYIAARRAHAAVRSLDIPEATNG